MKKKYLIFCFALTSPILCLAVKPTVNAGDTIKSHTLRTAIDPYSPDTSAIKEIPGYKYAWGDEFNYTGAPDSTLWDYEKGFVRGGGISDQPNYYKKENATVEGGRLLITAKNEHVSNEFFDASSSDWRKNTRYADYTSASILGKEKRYFLYGRIEVRAKIDTSGGNFPAIWTCGINKQWPRNGEIDLVEYYWSGGQPGLTANFCEGKNADWEQIWQGTFTPLSYYSYLDAQWTQKYHVWRMDWTRDSLYLYVDDVVRNKIDINKTRNEDGSICFNNPQFMMLNLALHADRIKYETFPTKFEVDYFRVYQKTVDTENPSAVTGLRASNITTTSCILSWNPSTDNKGVFRYDIYQNGGHADNDYVGSSNTNSFTVTGLAPGSANLFIVRALDSVGNYSDLHTPLQVITAKQNNGDNLLLNPSFETGTANWYNSGCTNSVVTGGYSGSKAGFVSARSADWGGPNQGVKDSLAKYGGQEYYMECWMKTVSGTSTGNINLKVQLTGESAVYYTVSGPISSNWTKVSGSVIVPAWSGTLDKGEIFITTDGTGDFYLDTVVFKRKQQTTGIEGIEESKAFNVFPNPSANLITCTYSKDLGKALLEITNLAGQTIFSRKVGSTLLNQIDLSLYPQGVYVIKIKTNTAVLSHTIIKE